MTDVPPFNVKEQAVILETNIKTAVCLSSAWFLVSLLG